MYGTTAAQVVKISSNSLISGRSDESSTYEELLRKLHMATLEQRRVHYSQNMLGTEYKCLHGAASLNLRTYLQVSETGSYNILRGYAKMTVRTTTLGLHSYRYLAPNAWNKLPDTTRKADTLSMFKHKLKQMFR